LLVLAAAEWGRCGRTLSAPEFHGARQFSLEELAHATHNFAEANLVGAGGFGLVYKGLLLDGTVVAIKRRAGAPRQDFADEACIAKHQCTVPVSDLSSLCTATIFISTCMMNFLFVEMQIRRLSEIWHRNVVTLIGYCQGGGLQMLVFEYLPNGSVSGHLYGNELTIH
jgi:serine/threonine protein kinase